ncbi:MAG: hypothetical protein WAO71_01070 [Gallionella sp.]
MMTATTAMTELYARLDTIGIKKSFARKMLPDWWDDSIATTAAGLQQAQLYFAKAFNLEFASLMGAQPAPCFQQVAHKFKLNKKVTEEQVSASAHYATATARLALQAVRPAYQAPPTNPIALRERILKSNSCIDLPALLTWCAESGIPVLHIEKLPARKMMGLAIRMENRFAIVLSWKAHPSELLFHLAHELGHIAKNHLSSDGFLLDETIGKGDDADEKEADAYAIRLLNGTEIGYRADGFLNASQLYQAAQTVSLAKQVDVGHVILNYGHTQQQFGVAKSALKLVEGESCGATIVNAKLFATLDYEAISEDQLARLHTATHYPTPD